MEDFPEEFDLHILLLDLWIRQAAYHDGMMKISHRDSYVVAERGNYTFCDEGHIKREKKRPEAIERILRGLIAKYRRLERNGYEYYLERDRWLKRKL
mgnify:FL=1